MSFFLALDFVSNQVTKIDYDNGHTFTIVCYQMQRREDKQVGTVDAHSKCFETAYDRACAIVGIYPLSAVKAFLEDEILDINADRINIEDWRPICEALNVKHNLKFIAIRSFVKNKPTDKKKVEVDRISKSPPVQKQAVMHNILTSIATSLRLVPSLTCLELQNLPIATSDMEILAQGLSTNRSIQHLSLQQCLIGDDGLEILSRVVKNGLNITSVNFSYCGLTWKSAQVLVNLLQHQTVSRHSDAWKETLRHEIANLDAMGGIQRLTINGNPLIGDRGAHILAEILQDDIWLKAIDIQQCGIQESGARAFLNSLKYNTTLYILDIRENAIRDHNLLLRITQQLCFNIQGQTSQFKWMTIPKSRRRLSLRNERIGSRKRGIPWRVAARFSLARHYNSHTPGVASVFQQSSPSLLGYLSDNKSESTNTQNTNGKKYSRTTLTRKEELFETVKLELDQLKQMLIHEKGAREQAEKKLAEVSMENEKLKERLDSQTTVTLDDRTLETIEATFKKFNDFLKLLQNAGYSGNLIDAANVTFRPSLAKRMNSKPDSGHLSKSNSNSISESVKHSENKRENSAIRDGSHENSSSKRNISIESEKKNDGSLEQPFISNALNAEKVYTYLSSDWSKNETSKEQASSQHAISHKSPKQKSKSENLSKSPTAQDTRSQSKGSRNTNTNPDSSSSIPTQLSTTSSPESLAGILTASDKF